MSSNGVMVQDYVPNAINNLTEEIWCAGAVIPAGKRVVIGHMRDGWLEITFTMGKMQDFIGMAMVPPSVVAIEPAPPQGFGMRMTPRGVAAMAMRSQRMGPRSPTIDQNAPLPQTRTPRGGTGIYPYYTPAASSAGPVWPVGSPTMMPSGVRARHVISRGFGAAGASEFTMKAAEELDEHLTTNGCAGCDDYKSTLRQLAFKFKAACMTDPGVQNQVSFNISTPLAMTAFGVGTDKALSLVLGQKRTYDGGPCTDDNGACLGNLPQIAQMTPVALGPLVDQVLKQIGDQVQQQKAQPAATQLGRQEQLVSALVGAATGLLTALSTALAKVTPVVVVEPKKETPAATPPEKKFPWGTVIVGGLIGTTILATGAFVYTHARRA